MVTFDTFLQSITEIMKAERTFPYHFARLAAYIQ